MDWSTIFQFAPGLVSSLIIVWLFLQHQDRRDERFSGVLSEISERHHDACVETMKAMDKASASISENTRVIGRVDATLARAISRLDSAA